jgi:DHA2 family integral membrane protein (MFS transporter)
VIEGGNSNDWWAWNTSGAIAAGLVLLAVFVVTQHRSSHPTIDVALFRNRQFSAGAFAIAMAFFALQGSTFYLAYYLQAVRGYSALLAGTALIAVAAAVMISAPLSARLSGRFGPRVVTGAGMTIFGGTLASYWFTTQHMSIVWVEVLMVGMGLGMGLTMSPATNAIMNAVPRHKAGAGSAVNNTVRQVAGALGVAVLGSLVAVSFRGDFGTHTAERVAARLDRPVAVVAKLPAGQRVGPLVQDDTSQSIGNALQFVERAGAALRTRAAAQPDAATPIQERAARSELTGVVQRARGAFMTALNDTSVYAGLAALLGALVAFRFLPGRREFAATHGPGESVPAPAEVAA